MPTIVKEVAKTWHGSLPQLVTLVGVEPALHDHNRHSIQLTKEKPACNKYGLRVATNSEKSGQPANMSSNGGLGEAGDLGVGEDVGVLGQIGKAAYVGVWR